MALFERRYYLCYTERVRNPKPRFSLVMFIGLPGAGKTTQATLLRTLLRMKGYKTLFVDVGYTGLFMKPLWIICDKLWRYRLYPSIQSYKQELLAEKLVRSFKQKIKVLFTLASMLNLIAQLWFVKILRLLGYILFAEGYIVDTILATLHENVTLRAQPNLRSLFCRVAFRVLSDVMNYGVMIMLDCSPMLVNERRKIPDNPYRFQIHYLVRYRRAYLKLVQSIKPLHHIITETDKMSVMDTFRVVVKTLYGLI